MIYKMFHLKYFYNPPPPTPSVPAGTILEDSFSGQPMIYPFTLEASCTPDTLSATCMEEYQNEILQLLQQYSRLINQWICQTKNCSYLGGVGVAINYATLNVTWVTDTAVSSSFFLNLTINVCKVTKVG